MKFRSSVVKSGLAVRLSLIGALALSCLLAEQAQAATVYTYIGNTFPLSDIFDLTPPLGTYTTSDRVTGSFTLQSPLAANLPLTIIDASVQSFSFSDGRNTITNLNSNVVLSYNFQVATDAVGHISNWTIQVVHAEGGDINFNLGAQEWQISTNGGMDLGAVSECIAVSVAGICTSANQDFGSNQRAPGTWEATTISPVPLPAALPLFATGLGALGLLGWRRKQSRKRA